MPFGVPSAAFLANTGAVGSQADNGGRSAGPLATNFGTFASANGASGPVAGSATGLSGGASPCVGSQGRGLPGRGPARSANRPETRSAPVSEVNPLLEEGPR